MSLAKNIHPLRLLRSVVESIVKVKQIVKMKHIVNSPHEETKVLYVYMAGN